MRGGLTYERGGMPLHGAVGKSCEIGATTEIKALTPSLWAKR